MVTHSGVNSGRNRLGLVDNVAGILGLNTSSFQGSTCLGFASRHGRKRHNLAYRCSFYHCLHMIQIENKVHSIGHSQPVVVVAVWLEGVWFHNTVTADTTSSPTLMSYCLRPFRLLWVVVFCLADWPPIVGGQHRRETIGGAACPVVGRQEGSFPKRDGRYHGVGPMGA